MNESSLKRTIIGIVEQSTRLISKHIKAKPMPVNYVCIFSQSKPEYELLIENAGKFGKIIMQTETGPVFQITPLATSAGMLQLLKIRLPDTTRPERGDADFTAGDYAAFKKICLTKPGFKLIERTDMEMLELKDPDFNVRVYFSHPTLEEQLGIKPGQKQ
jgi:hypothetical protein